MKARFSRFARRLAVVSLAVAVLVPVVGVAPVAATSNGCTPGYWKNHDVWPAPFDPTDTIGQAGFFVPAGYGSVTLDQALNFGGGPGLDGARRILLRAAVASLLNSQQWPNTALAQVWVYYNANLALESTDRDYILFVAEFFDYYNNYGACSL